MFVIRNHIILLDTTAYKNIMGIKVENGDNDSNCLNQGKARAKLGESEKELLPWTYLLVKIHFFI